MDIAFFLFLQIIAVTLWGCFVNKKYHLTLTSKPKDIRNFIKPIAEGMFYRIVMILSTIFFLLILWIVGRDGFVQMLNGNFCAKDIFSGMPFIVEIKWFFYSIIIVSTISWYVLAYDCASKFALTIQQVLSENPPRFIRSHIKALVLIVGLNILHLAYYSICK